MGVWIVLKMQQIPNEVDFILLFYNLRWKTWACYKSKGAKGALLKFVWDKCIIKCCLVCLSAWDSFVIVFYLFFDSFVIVLWQFCDSFSDSFFYGFVIVSWQFCDSFCDSFVGDSSELHAAAAPDKFLI